MKRPGLIRSSLSTCVAAAFLASCAGSPYPTASIAPQLLVPRNATSGDLLYVAASTETYAYVYVFSYPVGKLIQKIAKQINGLCSDKQGDVFMTQSYDSSSTIFEYAHGGRKPIATLPDPYGGASGCAVDPATGNLAVGNGGTVVVYQHAAGKPKAHRIWFGPDYLAYDDTGRLFALSSSRGAFAELDKTGLFKRVVLSLRVGSPGVGVQWDGQHVVLGARRPDGHGFLRQYTIQGFKAQAVGTTYLLSRAAAFIVDGSTLIAPDGNNSVNFFAYPAGGQPTQTISGIPGPYSVTLSVAP